MKRESKTFRGFPALARTHLCRRFFLFPHLSWQAWATPVLNPRISGLKLFCYFYSSFSADFWPRTQLIFFQKDSAPWTPLRKQLQRQKYSLYKNKSYKTSSESSASLQYLASTNCEYQRSMLVQHSLLRECWCLEKDCPETEFYEENP